MNIFEEGNFELEVKSLTNNGADIWVWTPCDIEDYCETFDGRYLNRWVHIIRLVKEDGNWKIGGDYLMEVPPIYDLEYAFDLRY